MRTFCYLLFMFLASHSSSSSASHWDDPLHPIGITTEAVASGQKPVLRVLHEDGHGGWQFYDGGGLVGSPVVMSKPDLLRLDPSLRAIKDLPVGWEATRKSKLDPWVRGKVPL